MVLARMKVSQIFQDEPEQWGLRGDPYLWRELKERLSKIQMPETPKQLERIIVKEYEAATGYSIDQGKYFIIERFMHGGLSSGGISPDFWKNRGIPMLIKRHVAP